ncbi:MAG: HAMP domain-containing histidine kinase [Lutibacter sp.]|nr:HAMP domain-containing histidine kinase [Lutibacter sp.]
MNKEVKTQEEYIADLEKKVVEISLKLKNERRKLHEQAALNELVFRKLIHNIKNPVGVALSFSEMILHDILKYTPEKLEKHLKIIHNSTSFSIDLLNSFAAFERYQLPDFTLHLKEGDIGLFLKNVIAKITPIAIQKNISILEIIPTVTSSVLFDSSEMNIALDAIIQNAIRYSNENTEITISLKETETSIDINIIDQGIGISEEHIFHLLSEFYVINTFSEDGKKCIGLGLSIANKIISMHNGTLKIASNLNEGTTVFISLPKRLIIA